MADKPRLSGEPDITSLLSRLLEVRGGRPGRTVNMTEAEVKWLCTKSREIFLQKRSQKVGILYLNTIYPLFEMTGCLTELVKFLWDLVGIATDSSGARSTSQNLRRYDKLFMEMIFLGGVRKLTIAPITFW